MLKKIIYYVRQFLNLVCISNGLSCLIGAFSYASNAEMQFVIGGIGMFSFIYGANKGIELAMSECSYDNADEVEPVVEEIEDDDEDK